MARADALAGCKFSSFVTAVVDILFFALEWIVTRDVDAKVIEFGPTVRHPVREHLTGTRAILDPHGFAVPETAHIRRFADRRPTIRGYLQQAVEGAFLVVAQLAQDGGQFHRTFQRTHHLIQFQVAL